MKNLIEVFIDTEKLSKNFSDSITEKYTFKDIVKPRQKGKSNISVIPLDTVSTIEKYKSSGKCCAINMASHKRPGGGVRNGARAQEEGLFRCSNLTNVISADFYPLQENECLYTENAVFFKDKNYDLIPPINCDIVTIAALRLSGIVTDKGLVSFESEHDRKIYEQITRDKIRLMCSIPSKYGVSNLILGAWGCGVFKNDPEFISKTFKKILIEEGYSSLYDNVIFGVINDRNSVANNFEIFSKNLN